MIMKKSYKKTGILHFILSCALLAGFSWSAPCSADDVNEQAKEQFLQGVKYLEQDYYSAALKAFETSYDLKPVHNLLFNIGMCEKALERYVAAIGTLEDFLGAGKNIPESMKLEAEAALEEMQKRIGKLRLADVPEGSDVLVDGRRVAQTPLDEPIKLDPGKHTLVIVKEGYENFEAEINTEANTSMLIRVPLPKKVVQPKKSQKDIDAEEKRRRDEEAARTAKNEKKIRPLLLSGIIAGSVGLAGIGVGAFFTVKYNQNFDDLEKANENYAMTGDPQQATRFNDLADRIPKNEAGILVGYIAGGALLATGVTLIIIDIVKQKKEKKSQAVSVYPTLNGVSVQF